MSIRFQRTPLIVAILLAIAAVPVQMFWGFSFAGILAGGALIMLALSVFAGSRSNDSSTEDSPTAPTVAFGPNAVVPDGPLTSREKRDLKKEQKAAQKAAKERAKFEKQAEAEAAKAAKQAAKDEAKVAKKSAKDSKKASKKGEVTPQETEEWLAELRTIRDQDENGTSPFGLAVENASAGTLSFEPLEAHVGDARADTQEIPVVPVAAATAPPAATASSPGESQEWMFDAYRDPNFTPPFAGELVQVSEEATSDEDDISDAVLVDPDDEDDPLKALPAEVDFVFKDEDAKAPVGNPAARLKALADRFQSLAADINHDWESLTQAYEQRDALINALHDAVAENERLKKELTEASENPKAISANVSHQLEEARSEVARLYEDNRELARLQFLNTQTAARLRELRFVVASEPTPNQELLSLIDQAIAEAK